MSDSVSAVLLHAAGSLQAALADIVRAFEATSGAAVRPTFGPSGVLKDNIIAGAPAHIFASANMKHPQALRDAGIGGPVTMFARNTLCALLRPGLAVDGKALLATMLDPQIKVGISTPKADPSGDYAFEVFAKAAAIEPNARATLEGKARTLTGAADSAKPPDGRNVYGWHIAQGNADIFLTYRTNALAALAQNTGQQIVPLPGPLEVGADYGLTVIGGAPEAAQSLAAFILSHAGQTILTAHGFAPPG